MTGKQSQAVFLRQVGSDRSDINAVDDAAWEQAVAREAVIRRLASKTPPNRAEFLKACRDLGLKRSRLYELISAYKARPVASSLLAAQVGTPTGSRRLPDEIEAVISGAIEEFYKSSRSQASTPCKRRYAGGAVRGVYVPRAGPRCGTVWRR